MLQHAVCWPDHHVGNVYRVLSRIVSAPREGNDVTPGGVDSSALPGKTQDSVSRVRALGPRSVGLQAKVRVCRVMAEGDYSNCHSTRDTTLPVSPAICTIHSQICNSIIKFLVCAAAGSYRATAPPDRSPTDRQSPAQIRPVRRATHRGRCMPADPGLVSGGAASLPKHQPTIHAQDLDQPDRPVGRPADPVCKASSYPGCS